MLATKFRAARRSLMRGWNKRQSRGSTSLTPTSLKSLLINPVNEGDTKSYGESAHNYYYYKISVSCLGMDDHPDLFPPRINCPTGLSETYSGDNSLGDDSGSDPILDGSSNRLAADDGYRCHEPDLRGRHGRRTWQQGQRAHGNIGNRR
jgi:hypothetical protein